MDHVITIGDVGVVILAGGVIVGVLGVAFWVLSVIASGYKH